MVKINHIQYLDDKKKIVDALKRNPLIKVDDLAKQLNFSTSKIYKIKKELNEKKKHNASIQFTDKSLRNFIILLVANDDNILVNELEFKNNFKIEKFLKEFNINLKFSYLSNGNSDIIIAVSSEDITDTKMFCNILKEEFYQYIKRIEIIELLKPINLRNNSSSLSHDPISIKK